MTVKEILTDAGFRIVTETSSHYRMRPLHRSSSTDTVLSVDKKTGHFVDFGTQESGSLDYLIKITNGGKINFEPEENEVDDLKDEIEITFNKEEIKRLLPSYGFYNNRGISSETLKFFQSGYCSHGKMYDRYVFPIINPGGELVGLDGRTLRSDPGNGKWIKWKKLGRKTNFVYPLHFNREFIKDSIIIVESIGNMLALWESGVKNCLVSFGTGLSKKLLAAIISLNPSKIYIALDNDEKQKGINPGQEGSKKIREQLEKWFDKDQIECIVPPSNMDWADIFQKSGKEELQKYFYVGRTL